MEKVKNLRRQNVMTNWLANVVALNVKSTSLQTHRTHFNKQTCPYLGEVKKQNQATVMS